MKGVTRATPLPRRPSPTDRGPQTGRSRTNGGEIRSEPLARGDGANSPWLVILAPATVLVLRLILGLAGSSPHLFPDEIGYIGAARSFVTEPPFALGPAPFYFPLYSLLISPIFALGLAPSGAFTIVMVVNALLGAATVAVVYVATRRILGASRRSARWAAVIVGVLPGQALFTASIWAENVLPLLVLAWLLSIHAIFERMTLRRAALVVVAAMACYATHPRAVVVIGLTIVLGAGLLVSRRRFVDVDPVAAVSVVVGAAVGYLLVRQLVDALLGSLYRPSGVSLQEGSSVDALLDPGSWGATATRLIGEVWYQLVATAGLTAIGVVHIAGRARRAIAKAGGGARHGAALFGHLTPLVMLTLVAGLAIGAAAFLADGERADSYLSGRYVDAAVPLLVAAGVVGLQEGDKRQRLRLLAGSAIVVAAATVLFVVVTPDLGPPRPFVGDMALGVIGQAALFDGPNGLAIAIVTIAVVGLVAIAAARRVAPGLTVLALTFSVVAIVGRYEGLTEPMALARSLEPFADAVATHADGTPVGADLAHANSEDVGMLGYQWFRPDLHLYDLLDGASPRGPWAIGPLRWGRLLGLGAELVAIDPSRPVGLYVLPGAEQDQMRQRGGLLPSDFPALLPEQSAKAVIEGSAEVSATAGRPAITKLKVSHRGADFRWPRFESEGAGFSQARIRLGARVAPAVGGASQSPETVFADLPADLLPGQEADVSLDLGRIRRDGRPLPPGEYRIRVELYQVGVGWFSDQYDQVPFVLRLIVIPPG